MARSTSTNKLLPARCVGEKNIQPFELNLSICIKQLSKEIESASCLKGQSNEIFNPQFFLSFKPTLATDQWVKIV